MSKFLFNLFLIFTISFLTSCYSNTNYDTNNSAAQEDNITRLKKERKDRKHTLEKANPDPRSKFKKYTSPITIDDDF